MAEKEHNLTFGALKARSPDRFYESTRKGGFATDKVIKQGREPDYLYMEVKDFLAYLESSAPLSQGGSATGEPTLQSPET